MFFLQTATVPTFQKSAKMDYELEVALFVGPGNNLGIDRPSSCSVLKLITLLKVTKSRSPTPRITCSASPSSTIGLFATSSLGR